MVRRTRAVAVVALSVAAAVALAGCRPALAPREPFRAADFTIQQIGSQTGAAFTVTGDLLGSKKTKEIVTTSFAFSFGPQGPVPQNGSVVVRENSGGTWNATTVVPASEGIIGPNKPKIVDVDGDGKNDIIIPAGYFFSKVTGNLPSGSITWWKNNGDGTFTRNDVITGVVGSYHGVVYVDMDKDGVKDIVTTFEDGGFPAYPFAGPPVPPETRVEFFKGLGGGNFAAPVKLANGGGSLPTVFDINADGKLDVVSAQYFGVKSAPIPPFGITDESFVWFENTAAAGTPLSEATFTKHVIARGLGESFQILAVDNLDGDGRYGAIGVNHTNPFAGPSAVPQVVRLTPGSDVRAEWDVELITDDFTLGDTRAGQAAPGFPDEGDLDGDGDIDIALAGDADFGIYWLERKADGSWTKHDVRDYGLEGANLGQGSVSVADLNGDGKNSLVFSSYNANAVYVMERVAKTGGIVPAVPHQPDWLMPY